MADQGMQRLGTETNVVTVGSDKPDRSLAMFWLNPDAFAFNLLTAFMDTYGAEALAWSPETIEMEIRDDFGVDISSGNYDRLMTAISVLTSNGFFTSVPTFIRDCVSLAGTVTPADSMIMPDCEELAWGITEALLISPPDEEDENPFDKEIVGFIGEALSEEGILKPPDVLRIAVNGRQLVDRVNFEFSDDPEMFAAIQSAEGAKTEAINAAVKGKTMALLRQLQSLPIRNGQTAFVQKMLTKLEAASAG
jgi:hypothetical protein